MVFNLNIVDLTIVITSWNKSYFINKKIIVPLNYLQFHYVQNSSNKNYKIRWNIIRNKIAVRVNLIHLKLIFEKKNYCLRSHEQCEWNQLTALIFRRKKNYSLNSRVLFSIELLSFFFAFQTQQTVGPINSNKRLLINQTACKMKPQETGHYHVTKQVLKGRSYM